MIGYFLRLALRHRLAVLLLGFAVALALVSIGAIYLTPGTERRTFFDMAYLGLELLAVASVVLGSTVLCVQEFEQKTSWLVLVRPVSRSAYVTARFCGVAGAAFVNVLAASAVILALTLVERALPEPFMLPVIFCALLESMVIGALACLTVFISTSYATAFAVLVGLVVLGYLSSMLPFIAGRLESAWAAGAVNAVYWVLPHLSDFSVRDFASPPESWYLFYLAGYAVLYSAAALTASSMAFSRREF